MRVYIYVYIYIYVYALSMSLACAGFRGRVQSVKHKPVKPVPKLQQEAYMMGSGLIRRRVNTVKF